MEPNLIGQLESVPPVKADELKCLWLLMTRENTRQALAENQRTEAVGVSYRVMSEQCDASSNILAIFLRATLVESLLERGLLEDWRDGAGLRDSVFRVAATFPFSKSLSEVDCGAFVQALS